MVSSDGQGKTGNAANQKIYKFIYKQIVIKTKKNITF